MKKASSDRLTHLLGLCSSVVLPLLREVSPDYADELHLDPEFAQCLVALQERGALGAFFDQGGRATGTLPNDALLTSSVVKSSWRGQRLQKAPIGTCAVPRTAS
jgi:hypothetical protein